MANFPTSKKTWTAIADATDYLQAAHLNEARDEITAIEEGYLEGSARLNSSNSTLATLSVAGGSTFADVRINGGLQSSASTVLSLVVSNNVDIGGSKITISSAGLVTQALQTTGAVALTWNDSSGGGLASFKRYEDTKMAFTGNVDFSQSTVSGLSATLPLSVGSTGFGGDSTKFVLPTTATFVEIVTSAESTLHGLSTRTIGSVVYLNNWHSALNVVLRHDAAGVANAQSRMRLPNSTSLTIRPFGTVGLMQNSSFWVVLSEV